MQYIFCFLSLLEFVCNTMCVSPSELGWWWTVNWCMPQAPYHCQVYSALQRPAWRQRSWFPNISFRSSCCESRVRVIFLDLNDLLTFWWMNIFQTSVCRIFEVSLITNFYRLTTFVMELSTVWRVMSLPLLEPLNPTRLQKLSTIAMAALLAALTVATATAIIAVASQATSSSKVLMYFKFYWGYDPQYI